MKKNKLQLLLICLFLVILPINFAEIAVNYGNSNSESNNFNTNSFNDNNGNRDIITHTFIVDKYYNQRQRDVIIQPQIIEQRIVQQQVVQNNIIQRESQNPHFVIEGIKVEDSINSCGNATYSFKITNPDNRNHVYSFEVHDFFGTAFITQNLILGSKESKVINSNLFPECGIKETINPKIRVFTETQEAFIPIIININPDYYSQEFDLIDNKICEDDNVGIKIKNTGQSKEIFKLSFFDNSDDDENKEDESNNIFNLDLENNEIELDSGEEEFLEIRRIDFDDFEPGKYDLKIKSNIKSNPFFESVIEEEFEVVEKHNCYLPQIKKKDYKIGEDTHLILEIENKGIKDSSYELELNAPSFAFITDKVIEINKGNSNTLDVINDVNEETEEGKYDLHLKLKSLESENEYVEHFTITYNKSSLLEKLFMNRCLILVILFLVFAFLFFIKALRNSDDKKSKLTSLIIMFVLLILVFVLFNMCFEFFSHKLGLTYHNINTDDNLCSTHYNEGICKSSYYIRINEDTTHTIDLSKWFYDPDNDDLDYTFTPADNLDIQLLESTAIITPDKDFYGTRDLAFTAKDGKGGKAVSKEFYIHVLNEKEFHMSDFILDNHLWISIGVIVILVLLVIFLVFSLFNSNDDDNEEEDEDTVYTNF